MTRLLIGLISAVAATNLMAAAGDPVTRTNPSALSASDSAESTGNEFSKLEEADDLAMQEVDDWIRENREFAAKGGGIPPAELNRRIRRRLEPVGKAYLDFIRRHPLHAKVRLAYAGFLDDIGDEEGQMVQLEKARELDPSNPAVWNNLANYYGHNGPVTNAFAYYEKAIALNSREPVYYHNFGTTVYLFRKDVREHYGIDEQQVFSKALELYGHATRLDPTNFVLASDVAMTYYGIQPLRTNEALRAWTNALNLAHDSVEREGIYIHLARVKLNAGMLKESRDHLNAVTNTMYGEVKRRIARNLAERESGTNRPPDAAASERITTESDEQFLPSRSPVRNPGTSP